MPAREREEERERNANEVDEVIEMGDICSHLVRHKYVQMREYKLI